MSKPSLFTLSPGWAVFSRRPRLAKQGNVLPWLRVSQAWVNDFAYLPARPIFSHSCCCSLSPNKRIENLETLHPICLGTGKAHSSPAIRLPVTILQTQARASLQRSQYLPAMTSSPLITNISEVLHPLLYYRPFCSSASESLQASVLSRACGAGCCHLGKWQRKTVSA